MLAYIQKIRFDIFHVFCVKELCSRREWHRARKPFAALRESVRVYHSESLTQISQSRRVCCLIETYITPLLPRWYLNRNFRIAQVNIILRAKTS